jgi:hypothetical protein
MPSSVPLAVITFNVETGKSPADMGRHCRERLRVNAQAELRGEADGPHHPDVVFPKSLARTSSCPPQQFVLDVLVRETI